MIRTIRRLVATDGGDNKEWIELTTLSSDTKPTSGIINGSIATEVDTGNVFFFDEAAGEWVEQFSFQNAGGGGGGAFVVNMDASTGTLNKTWQEIYNAMKTGTVIVVSGTETPTAVELYSYAINAAGYNGAVYSLAAFLMGTLVTFKATAPDGYPVQQAQG